MAYEQITYERRGTVGLITLNRPDKLNAWTPPMGMEQADAIAKANADPAVGAIVMTGAGRGFCAGADMEATFKSRIDGTDPGGNTAGGQGGMPAGLDWVKMARESKPLIAAVNGAAVGIGMTMILPFDVIVASDKAKLGMLFIKVGLVPELASTHYLVQRMGFGRASEMCLSGRLYSAGECYQAGLVDVLTTPEELVTKALEIAEGIASNPDPQLRMIKQLLSENGSATDMSADAPVELVVWSDYLCPWCYLGDARVQRIEREFGDAVRVEWRAFLLRPAPEPRSLERFRAYTQSWLRPAAEPEAPAFRPWASDEGPPSHSIPAHLVAKAAAALGREAFAAMHERLLRAYFEESRDITNRETQLALWREVGLAEPAFTVADEPATRERVIAEHRDALAHGATGVPSVMMVGNDVPTMGAMPFETYRRWIARALGGARALDARE